MSDVLFEDGRLAALYDEHCSGRDDTDFYVELASRLGVDSVVDLGCGTGVLAIELARHGRRVVGIDPARAMLEVARSRPHGGLVRWVCGEIGDADPEAADLVLMTGHVAQVFTDEASWRSALTGAHRALRDGGRVAFELRNPRAEAWRAWNPHDSRVALHHPTDGPVTAWVETTRVVDGLVTFVWRYRFEATGEVVASESTLRFPSRTEVEWSLAETGFALEAAYGDWDGAPLGVGSPEMIFVARRVHAG